MYSMWNAPGDRDYYDQDNPETSDNEDPEPLSEEDPFETPMLCDGAEPEGIPADETTAGTEPPMVNLPEEA